MKGGRLVPLVLFYVALDLSSPMIPGAFSFDPAESVEAVRLLRLREQPTPPVAMPTPLPDDRVVLSPVRPVAAPAPPAAPAVRAFRPRPVYPAAARPRPASDDD